MIKKQRSLVKNKKIPYRVIEGEAVLVDVKKGEVVHLNEVAAAIWDFIDGKKTVSDVVQHIRGQFDVSQKTAEKDVEEFISELIEKGLLIADEEK